MPKSEQEEEKLRREKLELLKMKQGIIEKSELIPEDAPEPIKEPHGFEKVTDFLYQNKWFLIPLGLLLALAVFLAVQSLSREKADIEIVVAVTVENSPLLQMTNVIEETIEMYCPDFDGNGNVHVSIETIDLSLGDAMTQTADVERMKFSTEIRQFNRPFAVCDTGYLGEFVPDCDFGYELYTDLTGVYTDDILYIGKGVSSSETGADFGEGILFCVRELPTNSLGEDEDVIERRERALIVLDNLVNGNIVNPK